MYDIQMQAAYHKVNTSSENNDINCSFIWEWRISKGMIKSRKGLKKSI